MNRVALLCVAVGLSACALADNAQTLRVMTFNIRYGTAPDGENHWLKRRGLLVDTIRQYQPDVLGLQECLQVQGEYLQEHLPDYAWHGLGRNRDGSSEMTAVFYRKDRFAPLLIENFWLSDTPEEPGSMGWDAKITRMATRLRLFDRQTGRHFTLVNTHFDHMGEQAREQSVGVVVRRLEQCPPPGDEPVIFIGDFNAAAGKSAPYTAAMNAGFRDAWVESPEKKGPSITFNGFKPVDPAADDRIDWILFKGPVEPVRCETIDRNDNGRYPSDHFPVFALFRLP
ncbi:MAG: endonuclease/exonuclease/phosphatase family protein [Candidatus Hydrogenedentes bacterium]|nr:endonuclease/exonuclease/phosphatase family protein [Candidatus Hydrogenedentota bacterium]